MTLRRQIETITIRTSRIRPSASRVHSAPRLFRSVGHARGSARSAPGHPRDAPGSGSSRLSAISGKIPVSSIEQEVAGPRPTGAGATHSGRLIDPVGREPRLAPRGRAGPRTGHDPQQRQDQQRLDGAEDPRDHRIAAGSSGGDERDDTRWPAWKRSPMFGAKLAMRSTARPASDPSPPASAGDDRPGRSGQVAVLEQEEREQQRRSTVQHAIAECRQDVPDPGDHRAGRDRRAGVEELERGERPGEQPAP